MMYKYRTFLGARQFFSMKYAVRKMSFKVYFLTAYIGNNELSGH